MSAQPRHEPFASLSQTSREQVSAITNNPQHFASNDQSWISGGKSTRSSYAAVEAVIIKPHTETMTDTPTREEMKARIEASEARVTSALDGMRAENAQFRESITGFKGEVLTAIAGMNTKIESLKGDMGTKIESVRTDHQRELNVNIRWMIGLFFPVLLGIAGSIATTILRTPAKEAQPVTTQGSAPIIIQVPAYTQPPVADPSHAQPKSKH